jgi:hypothetical protein
MLRIDAAHDTKSPDYARELGELHEDFVAEFGWKGRLVGCGA